MRKDFFSSFFFFLLAIYLSVESYGYGLGDMSMPGPGFFLFFAAILFGIFSLFVMINALRTALSKGKAINTDLPSQERLHWDTIVQVIAGMTAYSLLLKRLGFVACTFLLVAFLIRVVARQRLFTSLVVAFFTAVACELVFNVFLNAQIPNGILTFLGR